LKWLEYEGALYHITSRDNAQAAIYLDDDDWTGFLGVLRREIEQPVAVLGLLPDDNHYYLLVRMPESNLSQGV
jgi:putative transposase